MDPETGEMRNGWVQDGGQWYLLDETDGKMLKGCRRSESTGIT